MCQVLQTSGARNIPRSRSGEESDVLLVRCRGQGREGWGSRDVEGREGWGSRDAEGRGGRDGGVEMQRAGEGGMGE